MANARFVPLYAYREQRKQIIHVCGIIDHEREVRYYFRQQEGNRTKTSMSLLLLNSARFKQFPKCVTQLPSLVRVGVRLISPRPEVIHQANILSRSQPLRSLGLQGRHLPTIDSKTSVFRVQVWEGQPCAAPCEDGFVRSPHTALRRHDYLYAKQKLHVKGTSRLSERPSTSTEDTRRLQSSAFRPQSPRASPAYILILFLDNDYINIPRKLLNPLPNMS